MGFRGGLKTMEDIILEDKGYDSFNLIFQDFTTDIKLSLEKSDLEQLKDKINNILED